MEENKTKELFKDFSNEDRRRYLSYVLAIFLPHFNQQETQYVVNKFPIQEEDESGEKFLEYVEGLMALSYLDDLNLTKEQKLYYLDIAIENLTKYGIPTDLLKELKEDIYNMQEKENENFEEKEFEEEEFEETSEEEYKENKQ